MRLHISAGFCQGPGHLLIQHRGHFRCWFPRGREQIQQFYRLPYAPARPLALGQTIQVSKGRLAPVRGTLHGAAAPADHPPPHLIRV